MIVDAFKYPLTDEGYPKTLLIGSFLVVGSVLVFPLFVLLGFFVRAIGNAIEGDAAPSFEAYGELFIDGMKLTAIAFAYLLVFVVAVGLVSLVASIDEAAGTVGVVLLVSAYFGLAYVATSVLLQFCRRRRMRDAFELRAVVDTAFGLRYLVVVLLWLGVLPTLFAIGQVLLGVTVLGLLLIPATLVYELLIYAKLIGDLPGTGATKASDGGSRSENAQSVG